jgi:SpoIID/LytB domain protein
LLVLAAASIPLLAAPALAQASPPPVPSTVPGTAATYDAARYGPTVSMAGKGFGHGRGMSQWGSMGYAVDQGWSTAQILEHYYGGTTAGATDTNGTIAVRLTDFDGQATVVLWNQQGGLVTSAAPGALFTTLRMVETAPNTWDVFSSTGGCATPGDQWTPVATGFVPAPDASGLRRLTFDVSPASTDAQQVAPGGLIGACEPDSSIRFYRGDMYLIDEPGTGTNRLVNVVNLEQYLRGNVPRESPASWGDLGGGRGMNALRAQAVAARSYARSESRYPSIGAQTCDTQACQVYAGAAVVPIGGNPATPQLLEDARTDRAIAETAGQVRLMPSGAVARTEYSASTGGHTAGGTFPAVVDVGDGTAANPHRNWTVTLQTEAIVARYPQLGELQSIDVTARNGLADFGGRVTTMVLRGTAGSVRLTGNEFRIAFSLRSDWFQVISGALEGPAVGIASGAGQAYWVAGQNGSVMNVNGAAFAGSMAGTRLNQPMVGMAATPDGTGYWLLGADGGVFSYGSAPFFGSTGSMTLAQPVVGMAARPQGDGYWFVARDGGIFAYGNAPFAGSMGGQYLFEPVVGMAPSPSGRGYWLVASDGGIFSYGDAPFFGSVGGTRLNQPVVGMVARPQGDGYWFVARDGGVFAFGGARFLGGLGDRAVPSPIVGMATTPSGNGYRLVAQDGTVYPFGDAT